MPSQDVQEILTLLAVLTLNDSVIDFRVGFLNVFDSTSSNFDRFSITNDLMDLFLEILLNEINLIDEGSHSELRMKSE
jgi:hypothetical protein